MPTVMMMMILGMRSRDVLAQGPCTAISGHREGSRWGPSSGPETYHRGGETRLLLTPLTAQLAPFHGPLLERKHPPQNVSILAFFTLPSLY